MANEAGQGINLLVTEEAFKQLNLLEDHLVKEKRLFVDAAKAAKGYTDAIGGSKNLRDYSNTVDKAVKSNISLGDSSDKVRLAEIKLESARRKSFDDFEKRLAKQAAAEAKLSAAQQRAVAKQLADQQRQIQSDTMLRNARIANIDNYNRRLEAQAAKERKAAAVQQESILKQVRAAEALRTPYNRLNVELGVLRTRARDIGVEFGINSRQFKEAAASVQVLDQKIKGIDARLGQHQKNVGNYTSALGGLNSQIVGMAAGYLSAGQALSFVFDKTLEFERIKTPLTYILGSEGNANVKLDELKVMANDLGLEFFTLASSYKSFTAAALASNFPLKDSEKIFKSVSKAAAVLKLSDEQLQGSLLALQQMISKGNVQAEELRGQLSERLPGAFALAAKAMGVTEAKLNDLLKSGDVLASELLPKLADQLDKKYGDKAAEGISGLSAEVGKLQSALQSLGGEGSFLNEKLFQPIIRGARLVVEELTQMTRGSLLENIKFLFTFDPKAIEAAKTAYNLRDFKKSGKNIIDANTKIDFSTQSLPELRNSFFQVDEAIKEANKNYLIFAKGVKNGTLSETKDGTLASFKEVAEGLLIIRKEIELNIRNAKKSATGAVKEIEDAELNSVKAIRKRILLLSEMSGSATQGSAIYNRIKALQDRLKKPGTPKSIKADTSSIDISNADLGAAANYNKGNAENENISPEARLSELDNYLKLREQIINGEAQKDLANKKLTAGQIKLIEEEKENKLSELNSYGNVQRLKITQDNLTLQEQVRLKANQKEVDDITKQEEFKVSQLKQAYANGTISKEQYEQLLLDIQNEYELKRLQAQIDQTKKLISVLSLTDDQRAEALKTLRDLEIKFIDQANDYKIRKAQDTAEKQKVIDDKVIDARKEALDKSKEIVQELFNFTTALVGASFTNQLNAIQDEIDLNDQKKAKDIENVNNSVATEEEKADRIAVINARADAQNDLLEQKQRQVKTRQARADKAAAISQAIINGALAMTKVAAQTGILSFAFNPLIAALTGLQIATILAQPIPKFEHGGKMRENGLAMYGEVGSELMIDPSGNLSITPDKPTIGYVRAGTEFISNKDLVKMMNVADPVINFKGNDIDLTPLIAEQRKGTDRIYKAIKSQKPVPQMSKRALYEANNQAIRLMQWQKRNLS